MGALLLALALSATPVPARPGEIRCGPAGSPAEPDACAREECRKAEEELEVLRGRVLDRYRRNEPFLAIFRESQESWREYVAEEMRVAFHCDGEGDPSCFRSNLPADYYSYKERLLRDRIGRLKRYLEATAP